jgi:hypothetical protein
MESSSSSCPATKFDKLYLPYVEVTKINLPVKKQLKNNCSFKFVKEKQCEHVNPRTMSNNINIKNIKKVIHQEKPKSKYWPFSKWSRFTYPQECYYCGTDNYNEHSRLGHSTIIRTGRCIFCQSVLTFTVVK